jgi:hypothetical protein
MAKGHLSEGVGGGGGGAGIEESGDAARPVMTL